jgi:signal transduction histidine kinase
MWHKKLSLGVAGPTILVSLILLGLCTATAIFLYQQQARLALFLEEAVGSRKAASNLENTIKDMIKRLNLGHTEVVDLDKQFSDNLLEAQKYANTGEESRLLKKIQENLDQFHALLPLPENSAASETTKKAVLILEEDILSRCRELRVFNEKEIASSETQLRENLKWMAWGLVAIGTIASIGGIVLGFGMARALRLSIHRLIVQIRDAAHKLPQELPTVTLTSGNLDHLHQQIQTLVPQIENVVDRLQERERQLLRAEQLSAVGQLAAGVAHELRNPLTAVKLIIQSGCEENGGLSTDDLQTIELEIRRLEKCLQTFLDFARPPKMECRQTNLADMIEQALALVGGRARKQNVEVRLAPHEPVWLEADPEQLRQVLVNLALNALDAMPQGGLLEVTLRVDEKNYAEVRVLDSGPGIAAALLPRLFEPFVSGKETGLGLGLVVSRRIAEGHGGSLWGGNRPEGGACFTLRLPLPAIGHRPSALGDLPLATTESGQPIADSRGAMT